MPGGDPGNRILCAIGAANNYPDAVAIRYDTGADECYYITCGEK